MFGAGPLLMLLLLVLISGAAALQTTSSNCALPSQPQNLAYPRCPPTNKTLADAKAAAWRFAPIIYMHPLERYHLESPPVWFNRTEVFFRDYKNKTTSFYAWMDDTLQDSLMFMPRSFATVLNNTALTADERAEAIAGAPVDPATNRSTADVYYTVAPVEGAPGTWLYTYHLFYPFNGCSNQDLAISINGERQTVEYLLCPMGVHEGDLEHISVLVCAEDLSLQQTSYSQHSWFERRDCTRGQCVLEANEAAPPGEEVLNPVTFAGFESHANYYEASPLLFYAMKNASFSKVSLDNLGGVWVGDRTAADPDWKFVPTPENIKYLPNLTEIQALPAGEQAAWSWALFPGNWGSPLAPQASTFYCLYDSQAQLDVCHDNESTRMLTTAFRLMDVASLITGGEDKAPVNASDPFNDFVGASGSNTSTVAMADIAGPLYRGYAYQWVPATAAPIFKDYPPNATLICPQDMAITLPFPSSDEFTTATTIDTIINYLIAICVGAVVISLLLVLLLAVPGIMSNRSGAPVVLFGYTKRAASAVAGTARQAGKAARQAGKGDLSGALHSLAPGGSADSASQLQVQLPASGSSSSVVAAAAQPYGSPALPVAAAAAAMAAAISAATAAAAADAAAKSAPAAAAGSAGALEVDLRGASHHGQPLLLYSLLAGALYICGVVLMALGTEQFVENSVAAWGAHAANKASILTVIEWLIIGGLIVMGLCDLNAAFIILLAHRSHFVLGHWRFRNYLYSPWVDRYAHSWHIYTAGLIVLNISISTILFGLGLMVVMMQLVTRLICSNIADVNINGVETTQVCITVPSFQAEPICGWQVMELCYSMTNMKVLMMVLGSMELLWSHTIWLVVLLLSMWRFQKLRIVETDDAAPSAAEEEEEEGKGALPQVHEGRLAGGGGDGAQLV